MSAAAAAALFVIHSSTPHSLRLSTIIILSLIKSPNTPQRRLFDIPTAAFQASFPTVDASLVECRDSALFRK